MTDDSQSLRAVAVVSTVLSADWVLPVSAPPIRHGAVAIEDGRIAAVGTRDDLGRGIEYPDAVILPGFVNAHSHLEYAVYAGFGDGLPFAPWILIHVERKARIGLEEMEAIARLGAAECLASGITTVGDCSFVGAVRERLRRARPARDRVPRGLRDDRRAARDALRGEPRTRRRLVLRPRPARHLAARAVHGLAGAVRRLPRARPARRHASLRERGRGRLDAPRRGAVEARRRRARRRRPGRAGSASSPTGACSGGGPWPRTASRSTTRRSLCSPSTASRSRTVRARTRSSAAASRPLRELLDAGITVGLGTDSPASTPSFDIFEELRAALFFARARERQPGGADARPRRSSSRRSDRRALSASPTRSDRSSRASAPTSPSSRSRARRSSRGRTRRRPSCSAAPLRASRLPWWTARYATSEERSIGTSCDEEEPARETGC